MVLFYFLFVDTLGYAIDVYTHQENDFFRGEVYMVFIMVFFDLLLIIFYCFLGHHGLRGDSWEDLGKVFKNQDVKIKAFKKFLEHNPHVTVWPSPSSSREIELIRNITKQHIHYSGIEELPPPSYSSQSILVIRETNREHTSIIGDDGIFNADDDRILYDLFRDPNNSGFFVIISNNDIALTRDNLPPLVNDKVGYIILKQSITNESIQQC